MTSPKYTTTLAAETAPNTSAASTWNGTKNGMVSGGANVSRQNIHAFLYPGHTTKVLAQLVPFQGTKGHIDVGYKSDDPIQVKNQLLTMMSMGIDGVIIDFYGQNSPMTATLMAWSDAINLFGMGKFSLTVMMDGGIVKYKGNILNECLWVAKEFFGLPYYEHFLGRPLLPFFRGGQPIDFASIKKALLASNPVMLYEGVGSFSEDGCAGAMAWGPDAGATYENSIYPFAASAQGKVFIGHCYPGFDDVLAAWSPAATGGQPRVNARNNGQTWVNSFGANNRYFGTSKQLPYVQVITWNDYEEGTGIEPGIDSALKLTSSILKNMLAWTGGPLVSAYQVYVSLDGTNLAPVALLDSSTTNFDLSTLALDPGTYQLFVKAIGKAGVVNAMSAPVQYTVAAPVTVTISAARSYHVTGSVTGTPAQVHILANGVVIFSETNPTTIDQVIEVPVGVTSLLVQLLDTTGAVLASTNIYL